MRKVWLAGLLSFVGVAGAADLSGSKDIEVVPRFPQAQIVEFKERTVAERIYPLDSVRRISGRLRMSAQVSAGGDLTAVTYLLPKTHLGIEAFTKARTDLLEQDAKLLFWCEGRDCGSSSLWANEVFQRSKLYGPDATQAFLLAHLPSNSDTLVALYGITRGNGKSYLHVEQLQVDSPLGDILPNPATLLRQLNGDGELPLPNLSNEPNAEWGALLANVMRLDSSLRISLAGQGAAAWREALIAERVNAGRLEIEESDDEGLRIRRLR